MPRSHSAVRGAILLVLAARALASQRPAAPPHTYYFFAASDPTDQVVLLEFGARGLRIEHRTAVNSTPDEHLGPRVIAVVPAAGVYYAGVSTGLPGGGLLKVAIAADSNPARSQPPDTVRAAEPLGAPVTSVQVTPDGAYAWVTTAKPGRDSSAAAISVVYLAEMAEIQRIAACRGLTPGRLSPDGARHYSACGADDALTEIDTRTMAPTRRLALGGSDGRRCGPAALSLNADASRVYVSCRESGAVAEIDATNGSVLRHIAAGSSPGAIAISREGRTLVVADEQGQDVALIDVSTGSVLARIATPVSAATMAMYLLSAPFGWQPAARLPAQPGTRVPTSITLTPDDRYAVFTVVRPGEAPAMLEVIDLATRRMVGALELPPRSGVVEFWKMR